MQAAQNMTRYQLKAAVLPQRDLLKSRAGNLVGCHGDIARQKGNSVSNE